MFGGWSGEPNRIFAAWQSKFLASGGRMPGDDRTGWSRRLFNASSVLIFLAVVVGAAWLGAGTAGAIVAAMLALAVVVLVTATWMVRRRGRVTDLAAPPDRES